MLSSLFNLQLDGTKKYRVAIRLSIYAHRIIFPEQNEDSTDFDSYPFPATGPLIFPQMGQHGRQREDRGVVRGWGEGELPKSASFPLAHS